MQIVQKRDAFRKEKFYFQRSVFPPTRGPSHAQSAHYAELEMMDASTIFNGKVLTLLTVSTNMHSLSACTSVIL